MPSLTGECTHAIEIERVDAAVEAERVDDGGKHVRRLKQRDDDDDDDDDHNGRTTDFGTYHMNSNNTSRSRPRGGAIFQDALSSSRAFR